ncbi:MAG TPA: hypothetical protein VF310_06295 [Vicinamibacteria bacterium]
MVAGAGLMLLAGALGAAPAAPKRITAAEAEAMVRDVSAKIERIRGLKFKKPVTVTVIDGATARANFKAKIAPQEETEAGHTTQAYIQLGLVPPRTDLVTGYLDLAEKDVAGYYEHGSGTFYLLDHVAPDEVRGVMAHELTHALEDQNYDFDVVSKRGANADHNTAITAVIEGSAMAVMLAFLDREVGKKKAAEEMERAEAQRAQRLQVAPSFTQRTLMLPYLLGFSFLLRGRPWEFFIGEGVLLKDMEQAYAHPPYSTRQILHPEQYWGGPDRYLPQRLTVPDVSGVLGPGWAKATEGSIGELGLAVLTGSREGIELPWALLPARWTNDAAEGTVGDVYHHYVNGERRVTLLMTRWETERDADQFDRALASRGTRFFRFGANILILAGDVGDRAVAVSQAAFQGARFWRSEGRP